MRFLERAMQRDKIIVTYESRGNMRIGHCTLTPKEPKRPSTDLSFVVQPNLKVRYAYVNSNYPNLLWRRTSLQTFAALVSAYSPCTAAVTSMNFVYTDLAAFLWDRGVVFHYELTPDQHRIGHCVIQSRDAENNVKRSEDLSYFFDNDLNVHYAWANTNRNLPGWYSDCYSSALKRQIQERLNAFKPLPAEGIPAVHMAEILCTIVE